LDALPDEDFTYQWEFPFIKRFSFYGVKSVDGIFRGSSHQFDVPERSFLLLDAGWIWEWVRKMIWMPISSQWIWWCEFKKCSWIWWIEKIPALARTIIEARGTTDQNHRWIERGFSEIFTRKSSE
jgi:hypothetical protein